MVENFRWKQFSSGFSGRKDKKNFSMSGDKVQKLNSEIQKVRQQISDCQRELKDEIFNGLNQGNGRLSPQGIGLFYSFFRSSQAGQSPENHRFRSR